LQTLEKYTSNAEKDLTGCHCIGPIWSKQKAAGVAGKPAAPVHRKER
jgi:hypothetical protein